MSAGGERSADAEQGVEIDPAALSEEALRGLIEEFVTREGTDYGAGDFGAATPRSASGTSGDRVWSLQEKVEQVLAQIRSGEARIVFDNETETASVVVATELEGVH